MCTHCERRLHSPAANQGNNATYLSRKRGASQKDPSGIRHEVFVVFEAPGMARVAYRGLQEVRDALETPLRINHIGAMAVEELNSPTAGGGAKRSDNTLRMLIVIVIMLGLKTAEGAGKICRWLDYARKGKRHLRASIRRHPP